MAAGIGLLITAYSAYDSKKRGDRIERAQNKQNDLEKARVSDSAARQRRDQIRQARVQQASIQNQAVAQNVVGSSAPIAAVAGVQTSTNLNIGDINTAQAYGDLSSQYAQDIFNLQQPSTFSRYAPVAQEALNLFTSGSGKKS